jgi:hypothetical protein
MLNKRRDFGEIHGTGVAGARYMQDGHAYNVDYEYVWSNPGVREPPRGVAQIKTMEQAEREFQERAAAIARGERPPETQRPAETRPVPEVPQVPQGELTLQQQLMQLNVPKLQDMQFETLKRLNEDQPEDKREAEKALRNKIIKGPGAKDKLVAWLIENAENA